MWNFINRLKEPSTYAGFSALALLFGFNSETFEVVSNAIAGIAAAAAVLLPDRSN